MRVDRGGEGIWGTATGVEISGHEGAGVQRCTLVLSICADFIFSNFWQKIEKYLALVLVTSFFDVWSDITFPQWLKSPGIHFCSFYMFSCPSSSKPSLVFTFIVNSKGSLPSSQIGWTFRKFPFLVKNFCHIEAEATVKKYRNINVNHLPNICSFLGYNTIQYNTMHSLLLNQKQRGRWRKKNIARWLGSFSWSR